MMMREVKFIIECDMPGCLAQENCRTEYHFVKKISEARLRAYLDGWRRGEANHKWVCQICLKHAQFDDTVDSALPRKIREALRR